MWDSIMQVGKTPQITANLSLPPYTSVGEEITNNVVVYYSSATNYTGYAGGLVDLNYPTSYVITFNSPGDFVDVRFDMRRKLIIRAVVITYTIAFGGEGGTINFQISNDNSNWTTVATQSIGGSIVNTLSITDKEFRYFRIECTSIGGAGSTTLTLDKLRFFIDSTQYTY